MYLWLHVKCSSQRGCSGSGYRQPAWGPIWRAGSRLMRRRQRHGGHEGRAGWGDAVTHTVIGSLSLVLSSSEVERGDSSGGMVCVTHTWAAQLLVCRNNNALVILCVCVWFFFLLKWSIDGFRSQESWWSFCVFTVMVRNFTSADIFFILKWGHSRVELQC